MDVTKSPYLLIAHPNKSWFLIHLNAMGVSGGVGRVVAVLHTLMQIPGLFLPGGFDIPLESYSFYWLWGTWLANKERQSTKKSLWEVFRGQDQKWYTALLSTFQGSRLSHMIPLAAGEAGSSPTLCSGTRGNRVWNPLSIVPPCHSHDIKSWYFMGLLILWNI